MSKRRTIERKRYRDNMRKAEILAVATIRACVASVSGNGEPLDRLNNLLTTAGLKTIPAEEAHEVVVLYNQYLEEIR